MGLQETNLKFLSVPGRWSNNNTDDEIFAEWIFVLNDLYAVGTRVCVLQQDTSSSLTLRHLLDSAVVVTKENMNSRKQFYSKVYGTSAMCGQMNHSNLL